MPEAPTLPAPGSSAATSKPTGQRPQALPVETVDVAVIGADIAGLVAALAASKANPQARVTLFDTASEPPAENDGGVLLSVNGLRALKSLDAGLYGRLVTELTSSVHESLFFDMEGQMVRRTPLGQPGNGGAAVAAAAGSAAAAAASRGQRVSSRRKAALAAANAARASAEPDPASPPLLVGLHELREALLDALPPEVEIFGRHHLRDIEAGAGSGSSTLLRFALSPSASAPAVRTVRAKLVIGADGPGSAVRNLQFDTVMSAEQPNGSPAPVESAAPAIISSGAEQQPSSPSAAPAQPQPQPQPQQPPARIVWRGRFTLRPRDPDCARLRNFTTATRTWIDLCAAPGTERVAWLSPAGPNTFVWSASCPAQLLAGRGLPDVAPQGVAEWGKDSPYWRCVAMFEDFPQDFFSAMRTTAASAVVEAAVPRPAPPAATSAAAAALAAPWQWFSGAAALVGDAVYGRAGASLAVDDVASTALNLVLEDAAVLGTCVRQHGMTQRALAEYGRMRASRVSGMLALPLSSPERARLRDAVFLPQQQQQQVQAAAAAPAVATPAVQAPVPAAVADAAPVVAAAAAALATPAAAPVTAKEEVRVLPVPVVAEAANDGSAGSAPAAPQPPMVDLSRPSGGASRTPPGSVDLPGLEPLTPPSAAPQTPVFSRPSGGAGRFAPGASAAAAAEAVAVGTAATSSPPVVAGSAPVEAVVPAYSVATTPAAVWEVLLGLRPAAAAAAGIPAADASAAAAAGADAETAAQAYCSMGTPTAVWQALLLSPAAAHDTLASHPYDPTESPSLAWMALLGRAPVPTPAPAPAPAVTSPAPARAAAPPPGSPARPATAPASPSVVRPAKAPAPAPGTPLPRPVGTSFAPAAPAAAVPAVDPNTLLPKPVLKKPVAAAAPAAAASPAATPPAAMPSSSAAGQSGGGAPVGTSFHSVATEASAPTAVAAAPAEQQQQQQQAAPAPSARARRPAGADGKARGAARRERRPAAPVTPASGGAPRTTRGQVRAVKAAAAAAGAAKAAVNMTVHLGAAAALGGAMASAAHGVPVDAVVHGVTHGAVAGVAQVNQFWDSLNSLTLASSSLSSIDVSSSVDMA
ncbi:hypothetical protein HYH02_012875 [Chlamydomonas schloesseri]|uniref:FAD-binding domain-containing protein n=1 Tax=Chlamydomonas schloesseri TaxID=2026947 RepID=A0A835T6Z1_9CHLO|nr:hypothetical protein HYH02_012875 [Chlamydomonas schloesseri]|eukprot:KAG2432741.1 hypothetical protein HYH02_012875 [Chlamydomonas schloesseri]